MNRENGLPGIRSWVLMILVTLSGGFADSYSYVARGHVLSHAQTGNVVFLGQRLFAGDLPGTLKYVLSLSVYCGGLFLADEFEQHHRGRVHWSRWILLAEVACMAVVGFLGQSDTLNNIANMIIAFICGLQVHSFHLMGEYDYASTMCMGNMKKGLEALSTFLSTREKPYLGKALSYLAVIVIFAIGAGVGYLATNRLNTSAIWICCALLGAAIFV
ncbi:MAG: YoaK family protein [Lachnospiraceae bacterium]